MSSISSQSYASSSSSAAPPEEDSELNLFPSSVQHYSFDECDDFESSSAPLLGRQVDSFAAEMLARDDLDEVAKAWYKTALQIGNALLKRRLLPEQYQDVETKTTKFLFMEREVKQTVCSHSFLRMKNLSQAEIATIYGDREIYKNPDLQNLTSYLLQNEKEHSVTSPKKVSSIVTQQLNSALWMAVFWKDRAAVELLLTNGVSPHLRNNYSQNLLWHMAREGCTSIMRLLLDAGAAVDDMIYEEPALIAATRANKIGAVRLLLERGANPNIKGRIPKSWHSGPLHWAAQLGYLDIVKVLVEYGANIYTLNDLGTSPGDFARRAGHEAVVRYLHNKKNEPYTQSA